MLNYVKEKVLILKCKTNNKPERKVPIKARTTVYNGHKFNIQGDSTTGYAVSDNETGMGLGSNYYDRLKDLEADFPRLADYFLKNVVEHEEFYKGAVDRFNNAPLMEEE